MDDLRTTATVDDGAAGRRTRPPAPAGVHIPQLTRRGVLGVWAAAAVPMGLLAWVVAPLVADQLSGPGALARALIACLTVGLVWQFVLVVVLVRREQGTLRWSVVREALWLRAPRGSAHRTARRPAVAGPPRPDGRLLRLRPRPVPARTTRAATSAPS